MLDRTPTPHRANTTTAVLGVILVCVQVCGLGLAFGLTIQRVESTSCRGLCPQHDADDEQLAEAAAPDDRAEASADPEPSSSPTAPATTAPRLALLTPEAERSAPAPPRPSGTTAPVPLLRLAPKTSPPSHRAAHDVPPYAA